ncbi:hypothetical protein F511_38133 [Dorcoceras hygrometricum]|uniref:Uncharacterized protein n=1 Tax=Dorcoceras hygrometricum TaxID=472368 RepID=A0A2Z7DDS4_9LAMI|nr:hypothetical protein F511_38133 [Dorcoceras hygrometricum]
MPEIVAGRRTPAGGQRPPSRAAQGRALPHACGSMIAVDYRQSGPRPDPRLLRQAALEALTISARTDSPRRTGRKQISGDDRRRRRRRIREREAAVLVLRNPSAKRPFCPSTAGNPGLTPVDFKSHFPKSSPRIQLAVGPQPLWLRNHNSGPAQRIMVKRLATSPHDPLGITDSASSRGPTTIVAPESQFRTCPTDHGKASSNIAP